MGRTKYRLKIPFKILPRIGGVRDWAWHILDSWTWHYSNVWGIILDTLARLSEPCKIYSKKIIFLNFYFVKIYNKLIILFDTFFIMCKKKSLFFAKIRNNNCSYWKIGPAYMHNHNVWIKIHKQYIRVLCPKYVNWWMWRKSRGKGCSSCRFLAVSI